MVPSSSLFDTPADPPIDGALGWIEGTLLGQAAASLCVVAVAIVGLTMLTGRLPLRQGLRVVLGCFVLMSAGGIVRGISGVWTESSLAAPAVSSEPQLLYKREPLPQATFDPYAGASLRRE